MNKEYTTIELDELVDQWIPLINSWCRLSRVRWEDTYGESIHKGNIVRLDGRPHIPAPIFVDVGRVLSSVVSLSGVNENDDLVLDNIFSLIEVSLIEINNMGIVEAGTPASKKVKKRILRHMDKPGTLQLTGANNPVIYVRRVIRELQYKFSNATSRVDLYYYTAIIASMIHYNLRDKDVITTMKELNSRFFYGIDR